MGTKRNWTNEEDQVLVQLIQENPHNLQEVFRRASIELERTVGACEFRWYGVLGNPKHVKYTGISFMCISRRSRYNNRKVYKEDDSIVHTVTPVKSKVSIWRKILSLFK